MNEILKHYIDKGHFEFCPTDDLKEVCNAPKDKSGIYIWTDIETDRTLYIGSSGRISCDGELQTRKSNGTGLHGRLVQGNQFKKELGQKLKRNESLPKMLLKHNIRRIKVEWYVTWSELHKHIPSYVEAILIQKHFDQFNNLPKWNDRF